MINWNEVGYPGTSVFDGMSAAANWNSRALANVDAVNKLREWSLNSDLRDITRAYQEDEAATALALGKSANEDLRTLDKFRKGLYNSNTGYLDAINAINPLDGTAVRRLSKDGKNIETVRMDGTVLGTTPNRTGKDAENALLFNYGLGLNVRMLVHKAGKILRPACAFGYYNNACQLAAQLILYKLLCAVLPVHGNFWHNYHVRAAGYAGPQRDIAAVAAHDFNHAHAVMRAHGIAYLVYFIGYGINGRGKTDCKIGIAHVVIYGAGQTNGHYAVFIKLFCAAVAAVSADYYKAVYIVCTQHAQRPFKAAFLHKFAAARGP